MWSSEDGTALNYSRQDADAETIPVGDLDTWVHVAGSFDLSSRTFVLYKDGSSIASSITSAGDLDFIQNNDLPFKLGDFNQTGGDFLDGELNQVCVWSKVLSSGEVTSLYASGSGIPYDGGGGGGAVVPVPTLLTLGIG